MGEINGWMDVDLWTVLMDADGTCVLKELQLLNGFLCLAHDLQGERMKISQDHKEITDSENNETQPSAFPLSI